MPASKTVRFVELVEKGGRPEVHLSWTAPAKDSALQRAAKQQRVVTIHQHWRGTQKDFGMVGLELGKDVQFLLFPKSLKAFAGRRVVGIKYELFGDAAPARAAKRKSDAESDTKTEPPKRRDPRGAKRGEKEEPDDNRVIAFPVPGKAPRKAKAVVESKPERETGDEKPEAASDEETDPVKVEARKALEALTKGRIAEAKRRLRGIVDGKVGGSDGSE